jgi:hypothetical protein
MQCLPLAGERASDFFFKQGWKIFTSQVDNDELVGFPSYRNAWCLMFGLTIVPEVPMEYFKI